MTTNTTAYKIPMTSYDEWHFNYDSQSRKNFFAWHGSVMQQTMDAIKCMEIGLDENGVWLLNMFSDVHSYSEICSAEPKQVIELGSDSEFSYPNEAILKVISMASEQEAGPQVKRFKVYIPYQGYKRLEVEAVSEEEAIAKANLSYEYDDWNQFESNMSDAGPECLPRDMTAELLDYGTAHYGLDNEG